MSSRRRAGKCDDVEPYGVGSNDMSNVRGSSSAKSTSAKRKPETVVSAVGSEDVLTGTGCLICKQDNDHANLMLCEGCNGEYHTYCLNPPLEAVPEDDWFCLKCEPEEAEDNLDELVSALPVDYTSRFNEICWCQGGVGYGWCVKMSFPLNASTASCALLNFLNPKLSCRWPACIFNPCLAIGAARSQAIKNLGKKHLVYFFYCAEAPFEIKGDAAIMSWEMGLAMGYHVGRTAYSNGKRRYKQFKLAVRCD